MDDWIVIMGVEKRREDDDGERIVCDNEGKRKVKDEVLKDK
jgi:hypothetical protein